MSSLESPASQPLPLVRPADLFDLFQDVAGVFAFAGCSYVGRPNPQPNASLSVEFKVRIRGPVRALVVLRTTPEAARALSQGVRAQGPQDQAEELDTVQELANLFVGHLLTSCLGGRHQAFEPFLPKPSQPHDWPIRDADAACALLLETEPLELRYWQEPRS